MTTKMFFARLPFHLLKLAVIVGFLFLLYAEPLIMSIIIGVLGFVVWLVCGATYIENHEDELPGPKVKQ